MAICRPFPQPVSTENLVGVSVASCLCAGRSRDIKINNWSSLMDRSSLRSQILSPVSCPQQFLPQTWWHSMRGPRVSSQPLPLRIPQISPILQQYLFVASYLWRQPFLPPTLLSATNMYHYSGLSPLVPIPPNSRHLLHCK